MGRTTLQEIVRGTLPAGRASFVQQPPYDCAFYAERSVQFADADAVIVFDEIPLRHLTEQDLALSPIRRR